MTRANAAFLATMEAATARYAGRTDQRDDMRQKLKTEGILAADAPERVEKRLRRLNANFSVAEAILQAPDVATAGRRLESLSPQLQTADALGLERLLGRNDLIDVGFLERGYLASRSVGRITIRSAGRDLEGYGTGFLISPRLLLTNNHVLGGVDESVNSYVEFDYQSGVDGAPLVPAAFALAPQEFFCTDRELDFTVVAVTARNPHGRELAHYGWLRLMAAEGKAIVGELMNIVQHPNGEPKQLALRENKLVDVLDLFLHYETDTAPGSSGSPVFNDQWEVVALHHSGVPKRDANGDYVADDGSRWTPAMGEGRLQWIANEGVRISRVLAALQRAPLNAQAAQLSSEIGSSETPLLQSARIEAAPTGVASSAVLTVPLRITVDVGAGETQQMVPEPPASSAAVDETLLNEGLAGLEANRDRTYYDALTDGIAAQQYYGTIDDSMSGSELLAALHALLEQTHVRRPRYAPARMVYPWVDLHPDRQLRSIYSGKPFAPQDLIREDARIEAVRTRRLQQLVSTEAAIGPEAFAEELDLLEASLPYNCEHVVPQSSFAKAEPMRGDLHHLFTCESRCNSFRGNTPYFDFTDVDEALMADCGRREDDRFEPRAGKGAVARATMYFLLRYPGLIGDVSHELQAERLPILLDWHASEPVGDWERHRNAAIAELQGNRNPLIDHPDWAARIPFGSAFGG
ncbi:endonuclease [Mycolicibacterium vaccae]|uniref:endonuclease n=1 Tax=Mycolicibacterium vaccae TaxID=1810 RepID=UPI003D01C758